MDRGKYVLERSSILALKLDNTHVEPDHLNVNTRQMMRSYEQKVIQRCTVGKHLLLSKVALLLEHPPSSSEHVALEMCKVL